MRRGSRYARPGHQLRHRVLPGRRQQPRAVRRGHRPPRDAGDRGRLALHGGTDLRRGSGPAQRGRGARGGRGAGGVVRAVPVRAGRRGPGPAVRGVRGPRRAPAPVRCRSRPGVRLRAVVVRRGLPARRHGVRADRRTAGRRRAAAQRVRGAAGEAQWFPGRDGRGRPRPVRRPAELRVRHVGTSGLDPLRRGRRGRVPGRRRMPAASGWSSASACGTASRLRSPSSAAVATRARRTAAAWAGPSSTPAPSRPSWTATTSATSTSRSPTCGS